MSDSDPAARKTPPAGLIIRARRMVDCEGLTELVNLPGYRFGTSRLPFLSPEEVRGWIEKSSSANLDLVAVLDGTIVGQASIARFAGRRSHAGVVGIGIHDDWIGQGIGGAMLAALIEAADRWLGILRLELVVNVDNEPAIRLYRRFGFAMEGTHRAFALRDGHYVDVHCMARLGGPAAYPLDARRPS